MISRRDLLAGLGLAAVPAVLAGCNLPPPNSGFAAITFEHLPDIRLDVGEVLIEESYQGPGRAPHVEHLFPVPPATAALRWAGDRLVAAGSVRRARYVVREASVIEVPLETKGGIEGAFTVEQSERYEGRIKVELQILDGQQIEATAQAESWRSTTVPENVSLRGREEIWYRMTEQLMADLNSELEKVIETTYAPYRVL